MDKGFLVCKRIEFFEKSTNDRKTTSHKPKWHLPQSRLANLSIIYVTIMLKFTPLPQFTP